MVLGGISAANPELFIKEGLSTHLVFATVPD
jgi:hypothetical protein